MEETNIIMFACLIILVLFFGLAITFTIINDNRNKAFCESISLEYTEDHCYETSGNEYKEYHIKNIDKKRYLEIN